jgi:hypothetical protein
MKLTKILFSAAVAGAMAFAASKASAVVTTFPMVKLSLSGTLTASAETATTNGTAIKSSPFKTVSFNSQKLIDRLNASPTFQNALTNQFGSTTSNQVPAGSYFVWDFYNDYLIITNKNGFSFNLDSNLSDDDFGYLDYFDDYLTGTWSKNSTTDAGSEDDLIGVYFYFNDNNGVEIESYGQATLHWTYAAMVGAAQKTTLSASISGDGYYAQVNNSNNDEAASTFHASGSGTATDPVGQNPFYVWDY